jgi:hypothetical protein
VHVRRELRRRLQRVLQLAAVAGHSLLAVVMLVAVVSKLRGRGALRTFAASLRGLPVVPAGRERPVGGAVVAAEAAAAALLLAPSPALVRAGLALSAAILAVFAVVIAAALRRGQAVPCRCLGSADAVIGRSQLVRDVLLLAVALSAAVATPAGPWGTPPGAGAGALLLALAAGTLGGLLVVLSEDLAGALGGPPERAAGSR